MTYAIDNPKFALAVTHFRLACAHSRNHLDLANIALEKYGDHGPLISGCVRGHFPETIKDSLRIMARLVTQHSNWAHDARPSRVHKATMVCLGQAVASEYGSGFYGPQPARGASA